jgi:beta-galactosidase
VGDRRVLTRRFSSDRSQDKLVLHADDQEITADLRDATRAWFSVCDRYGAMVRCLDGEVTVQVEEPAEIVGDTTFVLRDTGGVGAVWVRSKSQTSGTAVIRASHPKFGSQSAKVAMRAVEGV